MARRNHHYCQYSEIAVKSLPAIFPVPAAVPPYIVICPSISSARVPSGKA